MRITNLPDIERLASRMAGVPVKVRLTKRTDVWGYASYDDSGQRVCYLAEKLMGDDRCDFVLMHEAVHHRLGHVATPAQVRTGRCNPAPHKQRLLSQKSNSQRVEAQCNEYIRKHAHEYYSGKRLARVIHHAEWSQIENTLWKLNFDLRQWNGETHV